MSPSHVVVDGSNIATEGRSTPSLRQLDEAIRQFQDEFPDFEVIVVVDATFGHRIDASERQVFDEAVAHGELVSPPAGAIGRGDAFVLRVAERVGALVLSNDSFQEFHAEHPWLFDEGRLIGGKPIPGVGWIFTPRLPVRGPRSRSVTSGSSRRRSSASEEYVPAVPKSPPPSRRTSKAAAEAIALATAESTISTSPMASGEPAKPARATKTIRAGKAATATVKKAAKSTKTTTAAKATTTAKAAKATKEAASGSAREQAKPARTAKPANAGKAATATIKKAAKSTKATTAAKATAASKASKASKATKATKATKVAKATREPASGSRGEAAKAVKKTRTATTVASIRAAATKEPAKAARTAKTIDKTASATDEPSLTARVAKRSRRGGAAEPVATVPAASAAIVPAGERGAEGSGSSSSRRRRRGRGTGAAAVRAAIEAATNEALAPDELPAAPAPEPRRRRSRETGASAASVRGTAARVSAPSAAGTPEAPTAVNDPLTFLTFVTEHPLGSTVLGTVSSFVSHGAMVDIDGMSCYLPLTGLGDPPPRRAREVVERGEQRSFVLVALDPPRRGAELALSGAARVPAAEPSETARTGTRRGRRSSRSAS